MSGGVTEPLQWDYWVHLDNANEVDFYGVHSGKGELHRLPIALETKRAFLNMHSEVKQECAETIINEIFGGMNQLLPFLMDQASCSDLHKMHRIIIEKNIESDESLSLCGSDVDFSESLSLSLSRGSSESSKGSQCGIVQTQKKQYHSSPFQPMDSLSDLSKDSISRIVSFLDREDIAAFKMTSYRNGIVCLGEMSKISVALCNTNDIVNDEHCRFVDALGMIDYMNYRVDRYNGGMDYLSLRQIWSEQYGIPLSQQLVVSQNQTACRFYDSAKNEMMASMKLRVIPTDKLLLFDKRVCVVLCGILCSHYVPYDLYTNYNVHSVHSPFSFSVNFVHILHIPKPHRI